MTMPAVIMPVSEFHDLNQIGIGSVWREMLTNISNQVRRDDPAAPLELVQLVRDGHQGGADDGNLKVDEEEAQAESVAVASN